MITEGQLCLDWFREGGYEYAYGPEIAHDGEAPERGGIRNINPKLKQPGALNADA